MISPNDKSKDCPLVTTPPWSNFTRGIGVPLTTRSQNSMWWNRKSIWFVVLTYALFDSCGFNKN